MPLRAYLLAIAIFCNEVKGKSMLALRPGGQLQFADIATGKAVPEAAIRNIDLWTD